ncbi:MAG: polysaccharide biosynthesis/export family protein [Syntrophobacteraceae bacterium]
MTDMIPGSHDFRHCIGSGFIIAVGVLALLSVSCSSTGEGEQKFDVYVQHPEDVKQLKKVETTLTMTPEKAALHPDYQVLQEIAVPFVPEYKIGAGDVIEVAYSIRYEKNPGEYRLDVQDKISITLAYYPQFNSSVLVRTDGKISVPLIGDVVAESKTPMELAAILDKQYTKYLTNPSVTVALEEFNVKIDELRKAITTASRGQSKIAPVTPDGRIAFPIIGNMQAEGYTLSQLEKVVNEKYANQVRNLNCTLILNEIHHSKVYIFGEVERQGPLDMLTTMSLLDVISAAGGIKKTAKIKEIMIFRNDGLERPMAFKVDLKPVFEQGYTFPDLRLKPADIVFVPKSGLAKFDDFAELFFTKGIYAVLPFSTGVSASYYFGPTSGVTTPVTTP